MQNNFDLKKYLVENKLTPASQKLKENSTSQNISPEQAVNKAIKVLPKLEKSSEFDKLASQVVQDPKLMQQLEKALSQAGASMNENIDQLDTSDLKSMALNLAKKGEQINEYESSSDSSNVRITKLGQKQDDGTAVGGGFLAFGTGGTLGAMFSSAIGAAVPALTTLFAGPAVAGAVAGVALYALARKVYQKLQQKSGSQSETTNEYFSFDDKSPEGQRIKNKPQDILNRRKPGQVASGDKEDYKNVVNKQGRLGKDYGNVGPKGQLPENGSVFSNY